ncbi:MAG: SDR family oxidoreductase [Thiotrichales bacterium]|nr:SDR family oxidoreductase [Thiotrichales bacterium]
MKVLVTGGTGFLGHRLVSALLQRGAICGADGAEHEIERIIVSDIGPGVIPLPDDPRIDLRLGDFSEPGAAESLVDADTGAIFHLAAVVSGEAEQNFELGMRINFHASVRLLDAIRARGHCPRLVFTSSVAAYGGDMPEVIEDSTILTPQTSYGSQKAAVELLLGDYSRKGFVDGRALRLPTVVVRPGKANAAASSFASAIIREPLEGRGYTCPVAEEIGVWLLSPRRVIESFIHAATLPPEAFGMSRALALPGMTVTVGEMVAGLREVAGDRVAERLKFERNPFIERIVYGWATKFRPERALALGFAPDEDFRSVVEAFVEDDLGGNYVQ